MWALMFVIGILRLEFQYLPLVVAAFMLNIANVIGYTKCSSSAREKLKGYAENALQRGSSAALENTSFRSWLLSFLVNLAADPANNVRVTSSR